MKLFILDPTTNQKVYLTYLAPTRVDLANLIGSPIFTINRNTYDISEVYAEASPKTTAGGAVVGGLIGSLFLPGVGTAAGGLVGGLLGNINDKNEILKVNYFNNSHTNF
jgi:hypothetical protein